MSLRLPPQVRLRTRAEFVRVQGEGRRFGSSYMTILALPNSLSCDRLGVVTSRKFGTAVMRNRAKRRVRSIFRELEPDTSAARGFAPMDVVVIPRREIAGAPFGVLREDLSRALARVDRARRR